MSDCPGKPIGRRGTYMVYIDDEDDGDSYIHFLPLPDREPLAPPKESKRATTASSDSSGDVDMKDQASTTAEAQVVDEDLIVRRVHAFMTNAGSQQLTRRIVRSALQPEFPHIDLSAKPFKKWISNACKTFADT
jgi:hypothetical protein